MRAAKELATTPVHAGIADRLGPTLFVAALAHGVVILGVTFSSSILPESDSLRSINVTVLIDDVDYERDAAPEQLLADRAQLGAGQATEGMRPTRALTADHPVSRLGLPNGADLEDGTPRDPAQSPDQLVTRAASAERVAAAPDTTQTAAEERELAATLFERTAPASLAAEVDLDTVLPKSVDSTAVAIPTTSESAVAAYLVGWRQRVERIGTANFPERLLTGEHRNGPTLEVAIGPQGNLVDIVVRKSSGDRTIDQAALRILRLAAPFEPLPASLTAEFATLRFAYEWKFDAGAPPLAVEVR
ncbi:MAG TPA: TonB family protein [Gammaproteobacteria bacterium]